jgi:hypothetical protein
MIYRDGLATRGVGLANQAEAIATLSVALGRRVPSAPVFQKTCQ